MIKPIIDKLFNPNNKFQREDFLEFVSEITWKYPNNTKKTQDKDWLYIREDICIFDDNSNQKIAIMIYKMPNASKVEKARSEQRNLISNYLKNTWVYDWIDNVLCAFYSEDSADWRLSFIKQEFKLKDNEFYANWKRKLFSELTPARRYSFLVESNSKNVTVKQRLNSLLESSNILVSDIEKVFSVQQVSDDFFKKYLYLYEKLVDAFKEDKIFLKIESESNHWDENFRENFVKKLLWQIVFLYFLQKKWWLWVPKDWKWWEWNKNFLQDLLKECLSWWDESKELWWKNFFNDYLEHLFYANLNQKRENDYSEYFKCRIPYLNWWLFEPINNYHWKGFEYVVLAWEKNNLLFKDIFATFDDYNFTVYENDPLEQDVAVDPEMLGKVFENLLPENERKGKWAFYTPREIVHYMCKESLKNHIINKTWITEDKINWLFERKDSMYNSKKFGKELSSDERYTQFWEFIDYAENIVNALKTVKIVDPAVWSWAFPMWLLKEIVSLRKYLQENILLEDKVSEYQIKKETLENCIYWVDLDPGAVEIAKLRFWLSLVIEEESWDNIDPLPNLDYKIMQWNSLIEDIVVWNTVIKLDLENNTKKLTKKEEKEFWNMTQWSMSLFADETIRDDILKRLKFLHKIFFQEKDNIKKKSLKTEIDHIEKELIRISWEVEVNRIKSQIDNIEWKYIISWMAWDEKDAKKVAELMAQISSIKEMEEKYKRDNIRSFFPWKLHFWEVFNDNWGFDIVIGNPPYVWEKWNKETFELIRKGNLKEFYQWKMDLLYFFFHLWLNIWKEKSQIGFITTNYYITADWAINLRNDFKNRATIKKLINLNELKIFETAKWQHNIITLFEKWYNKEFVSKNCLTWRTWYYLDLNWWKVLDDILNWIDNNTEYFFTKQCDLYDWNNNYIRLWWISWIKDIDKVLNKMKNNSYDLINYCSINSWCDISPSKVTDKHLKNFKLNNCIEKDNWIFVLDKDEFNRLNNNLSSDEKILIKNFIKSSNIFKYWYTKSDLKLIYLRWEDDIELYPNIKNHLLPFKEILEDQIYRYWESFPWFSIHRPREKEIFDEWEKIIVPYRSKTNNFWYTNDKVYSSRDVFYIKSDILNLKYILSILNSKLMYLWLYNRWKRKGENLELYYSPLSEIPFKKIDINKQKPFIDLVDQILEITKKEDYLEREDLQKQVKVLEAKIDDMVYKLYELTPEEIELVEESLK